MLDEIVKGGKCNETHRRLETKIEAFLPDHVQVSSKWHRGTEKPNLLFTPRCLLGVMWLQLALSYTGEREVRSCLTCEKWFVVEKTRGKFKQEFCQEACRAKAYRQRKEDALQLKKEGMTPVQIAAQLDVELSSVKSWLKTAGKAKK